jgi:NAD(P)-dependent dehydrogenase (short-subunit alcohol dehydrogenase family)
MSMENKVILITGSTDGIGKQTALDLAKLGATVLIHGRNRTRCENTATEIKTKTGSQSLEFFVADLALLRQIRNLAKEIKSKHDKLDVLINNAGVIENQRKLTEDGYEMTFAVNHLAYFLLTGLLLDLLKKSAPSRIINVSSMSHSSHIDFDDLQSEKHFRGYSAYSLSKLCNILFTYELAERLQGSGVTANCLHPGTINTKLLRMNFSGGRPVSEGSKTSVYLATAPELEKVTGKYFVDKRETRSSDISYDPEVRRKLWEMSERMVGFDYTTVLDL